MIDFDRSNAAPFLTEETLQAHEEQVLAARRRVVDGTGQGAEMLGWRGLALSPDPSVSDAVQEIAKEIRDRADVLVCVGIGGSYLGAEAVIQALGSPFTSDRPQVVFAGHHLSGAYHEALLKHLEGKSVYVNVISKSGSTLEPALAFRFLRRFVERGFDDPDRRIVATTGPSGGLLNPLADEMGYRRLQIPDDVGGRFSVLTPVGLLPIAVAGFDIDALLAGAGEVMRSTETDPHHAAVRYAADRWLLHEGGHTTEVMAVMEPRLAAFGAWWQQLFGESEGKDGRGLLPVVAQYTTDLHSLGQFVQQGPRNLVETFLRVGEEAPGPVPDFEPGDPDGLNYLAGKPFAEVNRRAYEGTAAAHTEGGVPNFTITLPVLDAFSVGGAIAFFQHAVAVGGYLLGVNPFDQPGVEAYKQKMFELLKKE